MARYMIEALSEHDARDSVSKGRVVIHTVSRVDGTQEGFTFAEQDRARDAYNRSGAGAREIPSGPRAVMTWRGDLLLQVGAVYLDAQGAQIDLAVAERADLAGAELPPWADAAIAAHEARERALYAELQDLLR